MSYLRKALGRKSILLRGYKQLEPQIFQTDENRPFRNGPFPSWAVYWVWPPFDLAMPCSSECATARGTFGFVSYWGGNRGLPEVVPR